MRELNKSVVASDRGLGVQVRKGDGNIGSAYRSRAGGSSDPELDGLLGTIRERRAAQIARERRILPSKAASPQAVEAAPAPPLSSVKTVSGAAVPAQPALAARQAPRAAAIGRAEAGLVLEVQPVSPSVRIFRVAKPRELEFRAGQAIKLGLASAAVRRTYSIASSPQDEHLEFCIEAVPGGRFTSQLFELAPGERLSLAPKAKGELTLRADRRQHVMVATVTGIAPLRSMLRDALQGGAGRDPGGQGGSAGPSDEFWILHGASYADELPYGDELAALASQNSRVHYVPTISRPSAARNRGWAGHQGRVETLVLPTLRDIGSKASVAVYACGHPEMVRGVREKLAALGYLVLDEAFD